MGPTISKCNPCISMFRTWIYHIWNNDVKVQNLAYPAHADPNQQLKQRWITVSLKFYQTFPACTFVSISPDFSSVCFGSTAQGHLHTSKSIYQYFCFLKKERNISISKNKCRHNLHISKSNHEGLWYLEVIKIELNELHKIADDSLDRLGIKRVWPASRLKLRCRLQRGVWGSI